MDSINPSATNVKQAVPFFGVTDIEASLRFYVDGLGFTMKNSWSPEGRIRWCWLELGGAAVMLQEDLEGRTPGRSTGRAAWSGSVDLLHVRRRHRDLSRGPARGLEPSRPFVGNNLWVTSLTDPDGYRLDFESPTDVPEDTVYSEPVNP